MWTPIIDISRHQGRVDFSVMRSRGVAGVIIRSNHALVVDDRCAEYVAGARAAGYRDDQLGFYTFCNPKRADGYASGRGFVETVRKLLGHTRTLLMLDVEQYETESGSGPVIRGAEYAAWLREHILAVRELAPDAVLIAYSNAAFWDPWVGDKALAAELEWIVPRYPAYSLDSYQRNALPTEPAQWATWAHRIAPKGPTSPSGVAWAGWQFSAGYNGQGPVYGCESSDLDLNIIRAETWERWTRTGGSPTSQRTDEQEVRPQSEQSRVPAGSTPGQDLLETGQVLGHGDTRTSLDGSTVLVHQADGNVVVYRDGAATWRSGTHGQDTTALGMQADGNLELHGPGGSIWASGTHGNAGAVLLVRNDGSAAIYSPQLAQLWATHEPGTDAAPPPETGPAPPLRTTEVLEGEGWWQVAERALDNGARWRHIARLNGGPDRVLHPGDTVILP
jgi:hypothetical protein